MMVSAMRSLVHVRRPVRHLPDRPDQQQDAGGDDLARIDPRAEPARPASIARHGADAARRHQQAGGFHRVVRQVLQPRRHQRGAGHQDRAGGEHHRQAGGEVAVGEQRRRNERPLAGQHVDDEQVERRAPPSTASAMISPELNQSWLCPRSSIICSPPMPSDSTAEADPVEPHVEVGMRARHEEQQAERGEDAEGQVDVEDEAPVVHLGQVAAEGRADDRAHHDADAPDRHRLAALLHRVDVHHRRLRQRHQRGAEHALQQAEHHHLVQRLRGAAQHGGDGEADQAGDEQVFAAEAGRHPADRRGHDRRGGDVAGQDPGDLVIGRRQAALHVGQRDIGDRLVERLHQRGTDGAQRDDQPVRDLVRRGVRHVWPQSL